MLNQFQKHKRLTLNPSKPINDSLANMLDLDSTSDTLCCLIGRHCWRGGEDERSQIKCYTLIPLHSCQFEGGSTVWHESVNAFLDPLNSSYWSSINSCRNKLVRELELTMWLTGIPIVLQFFAMIAQTPDYKLKSSHNVQTAQGTQ